MRTNTISRPSLDVNRPPTSFVTFILPDPSQPNSSTRPQYTTIVIPPNSTFTPGPHWHERYVEIFCVLEGRARLVVDGVARVVTKRDGEVRIEKGRVHEFMRADLGRGGGDDGDVVVQEWVDPGTCAKVLWTASGGAVGACYAGGWNQGGVALLY